MKNAVRRVISLVLIVALAGGCMPESNEVAVKVTHLPEKYRDVNPWAMAFSPDGSQLAVVSDGLKINIWDWRHSRILKTIEKPRSNDGGTTNPLEYSPDGRLFSSCVGKGVGNVVIRVWNTSDWSVAKDIIDAAPGGCNAAQFSPDGSLLVYVISRIRSSELLVYQVNTWQRIWSLELETDKTSLAVDPRGRAVAVGGALLTVPWDIVDPVKRAQNVKQSFTIDIVDLQQRKVVGKIDSVALGPLAWSTDETRIAIAGHSNVAIFEAKSGRPLVQEYESKSGTMNVRFTSDGRYFVESDLNGMGHGLGVKIWDSSRRQLLQKIPGDIGSIAVSRDGKYLAVANAGRSTIWQLK